MEASIWQHRIDILGANALPKEAWKPMLDELKAEHVPSLTPIGKRVQLVIGPTGRIDAFVYRTYSLPDEQVVSILGRFGITASVRSGGAF